MTNDTMTNDQRRSPTHSLPLVIGHWPLVILSLVICSAPAFGGSVEVEFRLVVHDQTGVTVDTLEKQRPIMNLVATDHGVEMQQVGLDLVCWARNVLVDGQPAFERYHGDKYIGRLPVARVKLNPGDHMLWPGDHAFTIAKDGTLSTQDPELLVDGTVVRLKCYPMTVRAYRANPDEAGLPMSMRVTPLPDLTVREAADHEKNAFDEKGRPGKPRDLLPVFDKFAPLTLWLPANKAGKGYLVHPIGLTCHLGAEGIVPGAGGGKTVEGLRVEKSTIEVPLYGYPVEGPVGGRLVIPGVEQFAWGAHDAGRAFLTNWYPRQQPYEVQTAKEGPVLRIDGDLRSLPLKRLRMDVPDRAKATPRALAVEMAARHLAPGGSLEARVRAVLGDGTAPGQPFGQLRPYAATDWLDLALEAGNEAEVRIAIPAVPDGVYRLRLGIRPESAAIPPIAVEQWVSVAAKRSVGLGLFTQRGRDAFFRGEALWIGLGLIVVEGALPAGTPLEADLLDSTGQRLPLLRDKLAKELTGRDTFILSVPSKLTADLAPGRYRVEARVGAHNARPLAIEIVDPTPRTHFANVLVGKYNVMGDQYQRVLRSGQGAEELAREIAAMGYNTFIGMTYDISRVARRIAGNPPADLEQLVRERPELGPWESYYQPSGRDRFLNAAVRNNLRFYENLFTYNDTMLPREPKILDACERYASLEVASMRHSPALQGTCLYDEFYDTADTGTAMSQMFYKAQEVAYRETHKGLTSAQALKALDRFAGRPIGQRRYEDLETFRSWPEHQDSDWRLFSARMARAVKAVMPSARNLTLQRFWGGNGGNLAACGTSEDVFADLDIAACVMYKDGGYGDRPVFAPMQADVMRVRDGLPVWTQLHTFGAPPLTDDHIVRQAFFALSQRIDGLTFFTIAHDYQHPQAIDNRDTVRDLTAKLCTPYGDLFTACQRGYKRVAIYYSRIADYLGLRKPESLPHTCEGLWVACMRAGFPADFLYDRHIREGKALDYDVVFAPGFYYEDECPPDLLAALKRLVGAGKTVAVERASKLPIEGIVRLASDLDDYDDKLGGAFPRNIDFETETVFDQTEEMTKLVRDFLSKRIPPAAEWAENVPEVGGSPRAAPSLASGQTDSDRPAVAHVGPDWLRCGQGEYMVVPNFAYTRFAGLYKTLYQAPSQPTLRFPRRPPACYDLLEMQRVETKPLTSRRFGNLREDMEWQSLQADLRYYPGKIYAFLPAAIGSVELKASAKVAAGADLDYQVAVLDEAGRPIDAGFPIEIALLPPSAAPIGGPVYRAAAPQYRGVYHVPVNVPAGVWKLRVRELISGAAAEASFEVTAGQAPAASLDGRTVWLHDTERLREFLRGRAVLIAVDGDQPWVRTHADRLAQALAQRGVQAKVVSVADVLRLPVDWNAEMPTIDGTRLWRGNVVDPGLFVDAPLIVLGKRYESRLIEALVRRDLLADPVSADFPGPGKATVAWVPRAFSNAVDTIAVLANDDAGLAAGLDALLALPQKESLPEAPRPAPHTPPSSLDAPRSTLHAPRSSFRDAISREDLVRAVDVEPGTASRRAVAGRTLVGTNGFGHNLFCFDRDGKLLWKQFLPEHNVYFARWLDGGRRVAAATGRGFYFFLLDGADGRVLKKFAATEWPCFHGGFNTYQEGAINTELPIAVNPPLRQVLIGGLTGLMAVDFDGKRLWVRDRAEAIAAYPPEAVQTAGAAFGRTLVVGDFALSPDGSRLAHGEYEICGSTKIAPDKIAPVWKYTPMVLDARTGDVLCSNAEDPGNHTSPWGWHVAWPVGSAEPWIHSQGLAFPLKADGSRGPLVSFDGRWLQDGGRLVAEPTLVERFAPDGRTVWASRAERIWVPGLDALAADESLLYRCGRDGLIECLDMKDGRTLWEQKLPFPAVLHPIADGLVAGAQNGAVARLDASGKLLWQTRLRDLHELPAGDYPAYVQAALRRDPDSTPEFFPVGQDKPGDYDAVLRMGLEQLANRSFESPDGWSSKEGEVRLAAGRSGKALALAPGQLVTQPLKRKVIPSATYLLEFLYRIEPPAGSQPPAGSKTCGRLIAGALLTGGKEVLTASNFSARPGEWAPRAGEWSFGRLAIKTMAATTGLEVGFEAEGGAVLVDDASFRPVRFPSANLLANAELHAIEPTFVRDIRVLYNRIPNALTDKLRSQNHVVALRQGLVSTAARFLQEQAFLQNGRLDDIGPRWFYQPDDAGFSIVLTRAAYVSHLVLYLNNATPDNVYEFISILANNLETRLPEAVALVRGNRRRFVVVHFPKLLHTDSIKVLPGLHRSMQECMTEIEVYGPLGGPEMAGAGRGFPDDPDGVPMFMGGPSHVPAKLPPDLVGEYAELGSQRMGAPAYAVGGIVANGEFSYGEAAGSIRSIVARRPDPKDRQRRWVNAGQTWPIGTITPTTTPARFAGRLLVGSADSRLHAVADNGMRLWSYQTGGRVYSSPLPDGDAVYFGSDDGRLYKVDADSGILIWEFATGDKVRAAPALADGRVVVPSWDGSLYAIDAAKGTEAWKAPIARYTRSSPAVAGGRVYVGDEQGRMHCFEAASGKPLWQHDLGGYISACPVVTPDGAFYAGEQGDAALVGPDGSVRWKRSLGVRVTGQPMATQSQLIVPAENGVLVLRRADGVPDGRFVPPRFEPSYGWSGPHRVLSALPYGDKLFLLTAYAEVDTRVPPRTYVTYNGAPVLWGPKPKTENAKW